MDALVVSEVTGGDVEQVICFACHEITFPHIGAFPDTGFEAAERFVRQAFERDLYDNRGQLVG